MNIIFLFFSLTYKAQIDVTLLSFADGYSNIPTHCKGHDKSWALHTSISSRESVQHPERDKLLHLLYIHQTKKHVGFRTKKFTEIHNFRVLKLSKLFTASSLCHLDSLKCKIGQRSSNYTKSYPAGVDVAQLH